MSINQRPKKTSKKGNCLSCLLLIILPLLVSCANNACWNEKEFARPHDAQKHDEMVKSIREFYNPLGVPKFDAFDESTWEFSLLAQLEDANIYLYGGMDVQGMLLYYKGRKIHFNEWRGPCHRSILPRLKYYDFNSTGENNLAVILHIGAGTETSMSDLHILTIGDDEPAVKSLFSTDVRTWFSLPMEVEISPCGAGFYFIVAGNPYFIVSNTVDALTGVTFGNIVTFDFDSGLIKTAVAVGSTYGYSDRPLLSGKIYADVTFCVHEFVLNNFYFIPAASVNLP